ncbi:MAG: amino acid ABC transporter ATP-binding protein, partial [Ottowia sp.]|nr:amino acid ABC transporter ATP-binding protein [Ottowia sp.]
MTAPMLEAENIVKSFAGQRILKGASVSLQAGEIKILIGPSGSGKSTLLQCINCLTLPDEGVIKLEGNTVNWHENKSLYALRQQVGMIFQDFNLFDHLTALANITVPLRKVRGFARAQAEERARQELERVGLADKADLY